MQAFEYANPATVQEALGLLGTQWGEADVLAGGTDLFSLMKEYLAHAQTRGEHQEHQGAGRHPKLARPACASARRVTFDELADNADGARRSFRRSRKPRWASRARRSATWERWAATSASGRAAGITARASVCSPQRTAERWCRTARTVTTRSSAIQARRTSSARRAWDRRWWLSARRSTWRPRRVSAKWRRQSSS